MGFPVDKGTVTAAVSFVDKFGNAAPVEGVPVWTNDREDVAVMTVAADGMSAAFEPTGLVGAPLVTCTADADLGAGVVEVPLTGVLDLTGGQASGGTITFTQAGVAQPTPSAAAKKK